jgi:hypothetical protein
MHRALFTLLAVIGLAMSPSPQAPAPALPARESFHLFLLAGQSNMAGRGKVEPVDTTPIPRVLMLDRARAWVPAVDPMHFDKPVAGTGLGRSFAARVLESSPGTTIGLIPTAVGGTRIDLWQPGAYDEATKSHPWDDARRTVDAAHRALPAKVAHTAFVASDGLVHNGDRVHFDSASLREFGRRYANAYERLGTGR